MNTLRNFIYPYTCTYYFVSTPNPPAATFLRNFLLLCEIFFFGLPPPETGRMCSLCFLFFILFCLTSFVCSLFGIYLTLLSIVIFLNGI